MMKPVPLPGSNRQASLGFPGQGQAEKMIYLISGAPRAGKSILTQQFAARLRIGWISTDVLMELLRLRNADGIKSEWNAALEAITANAEWFFPYLERFVWGVCSLAEHYVIEGVDFLPEHAMRLSNQYPIRAVFLGYAGMTSFAGSRANAGMYRSGVSLYARKRNASVLLTSM